LGKKESETSGQNQVGRTNRGRERQPLCLEERCSKKGGKGVNTAQGEGEKAGAKGEDSLMGAGQSLFPGRGGNTPP